MILKAPAIVDALADEKSVDPLVICPEPDLKEIRTSGSASVDLRLGTWFLRLRQSSNPFLATYPTDNSLSGADDSAPDAETKFFYVPFKNRLFLHPRSFILGATLEWIRLPTDMAGYVVGRSSWGRRGLIIATAIGVHPGFTGCLTLELSNVGEIPIELAPGLAICQLYLHRVDSQGDKAVDTTDFLGRRRPALGSIKHDRVAARLAGLEP